MTGTQQLAFLLPKQLLSLRPPQQKRRRWGPSVWVPKRGYGTLTGQVAPWLKRQRLQLPVSNRLHADVRGMSGRVCYAVFVKVDLWAKWHEAVVLPALKPRC